MKTIVITGSTRGLGLEMAKQFRKRNCNIVICGTKQDGVDKAIKQLSKIKSKGRIIGQTCNVANAPELEALADAAEKAFGRIDIWINNAGINQSFCYAWELSEKEINMLIDIDLKGAMNGTSTAMKRMIRQGHGAIYNVEGFGSNDAFQSCLALYGTAKRAVTYYTDAVAHEVKDQKLPIVIGKLSPGIMITDFLTSAEGRQNQTTLNEKTKSVYNILGDYPDVIAKYLVPQMLKNKKNGKRIMWLTNRKAAYRFMTAKWTKRDFFEK